MGSMTPWGELAKQSFQNFRNGLNTLSYGLSNAGSIFGGSGAGFQPIQSQQQPLTTNQGSNNSSGLSQLSQKKTSQPTWGAIGEEVQKQAPQVSLYEYLIQK